MEGGELCSTAGPALLCDNGDLGCEGKARQMGCCSGQPVPRRPHIRTRARALLPASLGVCKPKGGASGECHFYRQLFLKGLCVPMTCSSVRLFFSLTGFVVSATIVEGYWFKKTKLPQMTAMKRHQVHHQLLCRLKQNRHVGGGARPGGEPVPEVCGCPRVGSTLAAVWREPPRAGASAM